VHGTRVIRHPDIRFTVELTPPLDLPRDAEGRVDVQGATQAMTRVVEGWVREHPEQWLWQHRRWRAGAVAGAEGQTLPSLADAASQQPQGDVTFP
jgi:KDO2-lipid IV(A) lauroyltransferase